MTSEKSFLILNASAGSGKTYNLVRNYLKLILSNDDNKSSMKQILAITFTNKAANEMRKRIIRDLSAIAFETISVLELQLFSTEINSNPQKVVRNAKIALKELLHRYEDFGVSTIDKFNLRLIRSFSRELNLPEQFELILDQKIYMSESIDELLNGISKTENSKVYQIVKNFANAKLADGEDWNITKGINDLAKYVSEEKYEEIISAIKNTDLNTGLKESYKTIKKTHDAAFQSFQEELKMTNLHLFTDLFKGKSHTSNPLINLAQTTISVDLIQKHFFETIKFHKNLDPSDNPPELFQICVVFEKLKTYVDKNFADYVSVVNAIKIFEIIQMLQELVFFVEKNRKEKGLLLVSEFNQIISDFVQNEDAPFIYERIGNRYNHFFLDEFQDTSVLQWRNLIPLVHNGLSQQKKSLVVGDPKQSIYRFKNGKADQFVKLPRIYGEEESPNLITISDYFEQEHVKKALAENWRSKEEVVLFNNSVFRNIVDHTDVISPIQKTFYAGLEQNPKGKSGGYVEVKLRKKQPKNDDDDSETIEKPEKLDHDFLLEKIKECIEDGFNPGDICVLAHKSKICNQYATKLKKEGYEIVSVDSLMVSSDKTVQLIVHYLTWLKQIKNLTNGLKFSQAILELTRVNDWFEVYQKLRDSSKYEFNFDEFNKLGLVPHETLNNTSGSVFEICQQFLNAIDYAINSNVYVQQFLDLVFEFDQRKVGTVHDFLNQYEKVLYKTNVSISASDRAIKIMTSHKSKGLEFPVVIIPEICFENKITVPKIKVLNGRFVSLSDSSRNEVLEELREEIENEMAEINLDLLNLLYVSFTRAESRLYLCSSNAAYQPDKKSTTNNLAQSVVLALLKSVEMVADNPLHFKGNFGKREKHVSKTENKENKQFYATEIKDALWFPEISLREGLEEENESLKSAKLLGVLYHEMMEKSQSLEQAKSWLDEGLKIGKIDPSFESTLERFVSVSFKNKELTRYLSEGTQLNERSLVIDETNRLRPDKMMVSMEKVTVIDFKTGEKSQKHQQQIQQYCAVLRNIGFNEITGLLYYVENDALEKVV